MTVCLQKYHFKILLLGSDYVERRPCKLVVTTENMSKETKQAY